MEVLIERDRVVLRPRISLVEIDIADPVGVERGPVDAGKLRAAIEKHGDYLLSHFRVSADGKACWCGPLPCCERTDTRHS